MTSKESLKMNQKPGSNLFFLLIGLILLAMMVGLFGCATQKKAEKYYQKHPVELAKECAEKFPVTERYLPGDTVTNYDTLWGIETITDTLISEPQVITEVRTVTVPKVVTKTVTIRDTVVMENTAKTYVLNSQIAKLEANNRQQTELAAKYLNSRDKWRKRFFILLGLVVIYTVIKFRSKLGF
jgi:hypothetical protein